MSFFFFWLWSLTQKKSEVKGATHFFCQAKKTKALDFFFFVTPQRQPKKKKKKCVCIVCLEVLYYPLVFSNFQGFSPRFF